MTLSITYRFGTGETIDAAKFNANNSAIETAVNDALTDITTNTTNIATQTTLLAKYGKNIFYAYNTADQTGSAGYNTVVCGTELTDPDSTYNSSTYIWTPSPNAGLVLVYAALHTKIGGTNRAPELYITKNSTRYKVAMSNNVGETMNGILLITANGTSDTFKAEVNLTGGTQVYDYAAIGGFMVYPT